jgi:RNA polymerase sigma-B factor
MSTLTVTHTNRSSRRATACDDRTGWEDAMFARYKRTGDPATRSALIKQFMPLARHLARRYDHRGEPLDDLVQVASLGLVKAVDRFDPERGLRFSSYAVPTILGELKRYFRDAGWALHVNRGMQERVLEVTQAMDALAVESGRSPTPQEIAAFMNLAVEEVIEALHAGAAHDTASLDAPTGSGEEGFVTLADSFGEIDRRYDLVEHTASMSRAIRVLPQREQRILLMRFSRDLTQSEIADELGISQMHVSRLIRHALEQLRAVATPV